MHCRSTLAAQIPTDSWPTYHGDYSGRRYSTLEADQHGEREGARRWRGCIALNTSRAGAIVGGEGPDTPPAGSPPQIKSTPLMINGVLYFSVPDHVWALDARTGREVWHYAWKTRGGDHIGNRGVGILDNWLYFLTPDNYFVSLDVGDRQGALASRDRQHEARVLLHQRADDHRPAGDHRRRRRRARHARLPRVARSRERAIWSGAGTRRRAPAKPAPSTWPDEDSMSHGGGMPWIPGTYDPELNLYLSSAPAIRSRCSPGKSRAGRQPLHLHRSSRSIPTPARWRGTTR